MREQANQLAERLKAFQNEISVFIEKCTEKDWRRICATEEWPVGVTARHIAAGHYEAIDMARRIIHGKPLPQLTMAQIIDMSNEHAVAHADCTKDEVLEILKENRQAADEFMARVTDENLARTGNLPAIGDVTAAQIIEMVILESAGEHLASMREAVSRKNT